MTQSPTCARCGTSLPGDAPDEMCPKCLIVAGLMSEVGTEAPPTADFSPSEIMRAAQAPDPAPQQPIPRLFGGYRIIRPLGKGGMGAVYEAEEESTGRRLALKVLSHSLDSEQARTRFFREGRLAASVNHPNSVYVFGTEEIDGMPVITMELASGGTLQELVKRKGPLPINEAVDMILQIVAGLEAAAAGGVLHRDVKPSNCFIDADGTVKVGDFGLSISTLARRETLLTNTGAMMGTPAYASPEQLRGDEIDSRSDIYAVGVTLYFLLTGQMPFAADNMVRLLATVLERPAPSPRKLRQEIPEELAKVILHCLAKQPTGRFRNYEELRLALMPFTSAAAVPAGMGMRFVAAIVDGTFTLSVVMAGMIVVMPRAARSENKQLPWLILFAAVTYLTPVLTFVIPEGLWGATLGKAMLGLRVVGRKRRLPGIPRALLRAVIVFAAFIIGSLVPKLCGYVGLISRDGTHSVLGNPLQNILLVLPPYLGLLLLFVTARRKNGQAAIQDLLSGTRVVVKPDWQTRAAAAVARTPELAAPTAGTPQIGPYHVLAELGQSGSSEWVAGYDTRLFRRVWIRQMPPVAPEVPAALRMLSRHGRLRWLGGKRSTVENWNAYEALTGQPLTELIHQPQRWKRVRFWLADLAEELDAAVKDQTLPTTLALERVWVTGDGRAKLLDFAVPGVAASARDDGKGEISAPGSPPQSSVSDHDAQLFLKQVAIAALEGRNTAGANLADYAPMIPMPLRARSVVTRIGKFPTFDKLLAELGEIREMPAEISVARRTVLLTGCVLPGLMASAFIVISMWSVMTVAHAFAGTPRQFMDLKICLDKLQSMQRDHRADGMDQSLEIYIAGRFKTLVNNPQAWNNGTYKNMLTPAEQHMAENIVASHGTATEKEFNEASERVKALGVELKTPGTEKFPRNAMAMMAAAAPALT